MPVLAATCVTNFQKSARQKKTEQLKHQFCFVFLVFMTNKLEIVMFTTSSVIPHTVKRNCIKNVSQQTSITVKFCSAGFNIQRLDVK